MAKQPNILFLMVDQLAPQVLEPWGGTVCMTPTINALARNGVVFENAYCNYPICGPARFSFMSGSLPSRIGALDNATEFSSEIPTFAHYLRDLGYHTCLSGKMHFIGADQLHGFEDRVTTDVYPADFLWTTDWKLDPTEWVPWYHSMASIKHAGSAPRSMNTEFDLETQQEAVRWLYDHSEHQGDRPFFLAASFISPHDPYLAPNSHWKLYEDLEIDAPKVWNVPPDQQDEHSKRLFYTTGRHMDPITMAEVLNMRRAYYAVMSWIDDRIKALLVALDDLGLREDTIIVLTGDHGDMLGERGLFFKMSFHEYSARVPLLVNAPSTYSPRRVKQNVSLVDLMPTFLDWANDGKQPELYRPIDGHSLDGLLSGNSEGWADIVLGEYNAEGTQYPLFMVRKGDFKLIHSENDPPLLYDLANDPDELDNKARNPSHAAVLAELNRTLRATWDPDALRERILESQRRRLWLGRVLKIGKVTPWDYQPQRDASRMYLRTVEDNQKVLTDGKIGS